MMNLMMIDHYDLVEFHDYFQNQPIISRLRDGFFCVKKNVPKKIDLFLSVILSYVLSHFEMCSF